jgi:HAD superfamily hydrolase (TIGR01509 family)
MADGSNADCPVQGVILDIDGTLLDSNAEHAEAWADALAEHGYYVDPSHIRPLIGMGGDKVLPKLIGVSEEGPTGQKISKRRGQIFREKYLARIRPFPKVRDLVERLEREGRSIVVASSASKEDLRALLEKAGVRDLLDGETSSDDAERSKPDPDIVHAAMEKLDLPRERVMMIGDTPYDVEAAARAGIRAIALRSGGGWSDIDLQGATAIYTDPADLLAHLDESPLGCK